MARLHSTDPSSPLHVSVLLLLLLLPAATAVQYSKLCHSPAEAADLLAPNRPTHVPDLSTGYFSDGEGLLFTTDPSFPRSFSFTARSASRTVDPAITHLSATVTLSGYRTVGRRREVRPHSVSFDLEGYYSTASASAELCMVGSGSRAREDGQGVFVLPGVAFRLTIPNPANLSRPFVTGRLESPDFGNVTLLAYAAGDDYAYAESASCPPLRVAARDARLRVNSTFWCRRLGALLLRSSYSLEYASSSSSSPMRRRHRSMYVDQLRCAADGAVRAYAVFDDDAGQSDGSYSNYTAQRGRGFMVGDEALVANGFWDPTRRRVCLKACRVAGRSGADLTVRECGIGMSFWFPAVWSIRDRSVVGGLIWNTTGDDDENAISVSRTGRYTDDLFGIKYNYTRVEEAKKYYDSHPEMGAKRNGSFPGNYSYQDYAFDFFVKQLPSGSRFPGNYSHGRYGPPYGRASPVTIGPTLLDQVSMVAVAAFWQYAPADLGKKLLNVSYDIHLYATQHEQDRRFSAEGVYDTESGSLCMVACRRASNGSPDDCEVLVTVQFAPVEAEVRERAAGTIRSLRKKGDPLFFEPLSIAADGMYRVQVAESISRMDWEGVALVLSMTLSCVFVLLQLRHARRNPDALPATSVTMLAVVAVGYMIPLVLNFEAMFADSRKNYFVKLTSGGGWLELNEVMLRVSTMLAFVLHLRLLQLAWSSRSAADGTAAAERSALWICLPLYLLGGVLVWIIHIGDGHVQRNQTLAPITPRRSTLSDDLVSYAGLILDGFLLPQVVLNAFSASRAQALSPWFYAGGTAIRAAPHVYDVFRARSYVPTRTPSSYIYASPRDDLFSVAWDVAIPCGAAFLAALIFLQQRLGGAFLCCLKTRSSGEYEMVSTAANS